MAARRWWPIGLLLGACASVPEEAGFPDAARVVRERGNVEIRWSKTSKDAEEIEAKVDELLARELDADGAVAVALIENRHLQALYEDLRIAQADLVEAGLVKNPIFHAEARFPEGGGRVAWDLGLEAEFLSILYLPLRKRVAAASFEATKLRVAEHVLETVSLPQLLVIKPLSRSTPSTASVWRSTAYSSSCPQSLRQEGEDDRA